MKPLKIGLLAAAILSFVMMTPPSSAQIASCANEGGTCTRDATIPDPYKVVRFFGVDQDKLGPPGFSLVTRTEGIDSYPCNANGGDPAFGLPNKKCYQAQDVAKASADWSNCAQEGQLCNPNVPDLGYKRARFGANGKWIYFFIAGPMTCSTDWVSGVDPAPGTPKTCQVSDSTLVTPQQAKFQSCGQEGSSCNLDQLAAPALSNSLVLFGVPGHWIVKEINGPGSIPCANNTFHNNDPAPGTSKNCYAALEDTHLKIAGLSGKWDLVFDCTTGGSTSCGQKLTTTIGTKRGQQLTKTSSYTKSVTDAIKASISYKYGNATASAEASHSVTDSETTTNSVMDSFETSEQTSKEQFCNNGAWYQWVVTLSYTCDDLNQCQPITTRTQENSCLPSSTPPAAKWTATLNNGPKSSITR